MIVLQLRFNYVKISVRFLVNSWSITTVNIKPIKNFSIRATQ